jgi:hypothetical protein
MRLAGLSSAATALALAALSCSSSDDKNNSNDDDPAAGGCGAPDQDGVIGGGFTFELDISDTDFSPKILKSQNNGNVTLTVKNTGTKPHDFVVQCLTASGCTGCFPDTSKVPALQSGESKVVTFTAPPLEGIYAFSSDLPGDTMTGQFIVQ